MSRWTSADIPPQTRVTADGSPGQARSVLITGATSGLGEQSAIALARGGAHVILAARNPQRAARSEAKVRAAAPDARVDVVALDLADLSSVAEAAEATAALVPDGLDVLMNNAGIMAVPQGRTVDGFERQIGVNHLGHVALTARLLPLLLQAPAPRVVTVSSAMHRRGRIALDDLDSTRSYQAWAVYGQSKLANLLFAFELQRRAEAAGLPLISVAAHPGWAATNLQASDERRRGGVLGTVQNALMSVANRLLAQDAAAGAWPQLYAATMPDVRGGEYFGPGGRMESRGHPTRVGCSDAARDEDVAARLWALSVERVGVDFTALATAGPADGARD